MADEVGRVGMVGAAPSSKGLAVDAGIAEFSSGTCSAVNSGDFSVIVRDSLLIRRGMRCK